MDVLLAFRRVLIFAAIVVAGTLVLRADIPTGDAELQYQLGTLLFEETRYQEALEAFDNATRAEDAVLASRARKGKVRTALRVAEFSLALEEAERLRADLPTDPEVLALRGDALWASGLFDESERVFEEVLRLAPGSSRARFGRARALTTRSQLDSALEEGLQAVAAAPRDGEIHALIGRIYERQGRFDEAAGAYTNYVNLLPNKDRSVKAAYARAQVRFLEAFEGLTPVDVDAEDVGVTHTVPFRLVNDKIVVRASINGGSRRDFVLDTGSEKTVISREVARRFGVRPITYTISAGVGEIGVRGLQLGRLDEFEIGTLQVRNLPVLIKNPGLRGMPRREGESFSPLALGMSMAIDYQNRTLTIARQLPREVGDVHLPMRIHRLAMVRGLLNASLPTYFVVDTGGEVISISTATAGTLPESGYRRIPLRVWGTSGWDPDAFLLPGVDLDFDRIEYRNYPLVVLNLQAPSALLGFQVGGIVGHKFLEDYRVSMDMAAGELRLTEY